MPGSGIVQMPLPVWISTHPTGPVSAGFGSEQRVEPIPPKPNRFVNDIDIMFVQQIFHISHRKSKSDVLHHRQTDDLWACLEIVEGIVFFHSKSYFATLPVSTSFPLAMPQRGSIRVIPLYPNAITKARMAWRSFSFWKHRCSCAYYCERFFWNTRAK